MPHEIAIDVERRFIAVRITGLLEVADVHAYVAELKERYAGKIGAGPYVMLIDISRCALQSQAVIDAFRTHIAAFPKARRIAIVSGSATARMQMQQLLARDYLRYFDGYREASAWLLADPEPR